MLKLFQFFFWMRTKWTAFYVEGKVAHFFWKEKKKPYTFESHGVALFLQLYLCLWAGKRLHSSIKQIGKREAPAQDLPFILEREVGSSVYSMLSCDVVYASVYALQSVLTAASQKQVLWNH